MIKEKGNLVISWLLMAIVAFLTAKYDTIAVVLLLIAPIFRSQEHEKAFGKIFYQKNKNSAKIALNITAALGVIILIYTLYMVIKDPTSSENLPGIWTIMFILSPLIILYAKYEINLYRYYTKIA